MTCCGRVITSTLGNIEKVEKGVWGMPRLQEAMKDVISCDKPRGLANMSLIRGFPNGTTHHAEGMVPARGQTRGTETSKYPEEEKTISDSASSGERTRNSPNHGH